ELDKKIEEFEKRLNTIFTQNEACQRIAKVEGIGVLTATAMIAAIGDINVFKNGRHLAAFLGLIPRQHSSGNKQQLLGISKRGDTYLRMLLVHGARSALRVAHRRTDRKSRWVIDLKARSGE